MITIKTPEEIAIMSEGGKILARVVEELKKEVRPGITTEELDKLSEELLLKSGAKPAFKGYREDNSSAPYPASLCVSVNNEVVHCPPSDKILNEGDIVSLDLGALYKGFYSDMAITVPVGKTNEVAKKLINVTKESLAIAIKQVRPGKYLDDISNAIQKHVEKNGFAVVRELCGHGIGKELHEDPQILNFVSGGGMTRKKKDNKLIEGMVVCIEPITTAGSYNIKRVGLCYKTKDDSLSCHFEHTIAVTNGGSKILTKP